MYKSSLTPGAEDAFVITGDITAMWIRDSANQVAPYLALAAKDPNATALIRGVLRRQAEFILVDPFANAFQLPGSIPRLVSPAASLAQVCRPQSLVAALVVRPWKRWR